MSSRRRRFNGAEMVSVGISQLGIDILQVQVSPRVCVNQDTGPEEDL